MTSSNRFTDMAKQAFSFLEDAGFRLSHADAARLQYETAQVFVTIEWDARSGETNVFVGLKSKKGEPPDAFSLSDLLGMQDVDVPERKMPFQVAEENRLGPFLEKLAGRHASTCAASISWRSYVLPSTEGVQECAVSSVHARYGAATRPFGSRQGLA